MSVLGAYIPGDPMLVENIVWELKSQGIFDNFRKECISDVDTKPAYQNLRQRVEGSVSSFLRKQKWSPDMNKNHVRELLRKNIYESGYLETGVERIVDQVVNPKMNTIFLPKVTEVVYKYLGIEKPENNGEPETKVKQEEDIKSTDIKDSTISIVKEESMDVSQGSEDIKQEDEESPPFEPLDDDNSMDSHLSGFSGLVSHDSNDSSKPLQIDLNAEASNSNIEDVKMEVENSNVTTKSSNAENSDQINTNNAVGIKKENEKKDGKEKSLSSSKGKHHSDSKSDRHRHDSSRSKDKHRDKERSDKHSSSKDKHRSSTKHSNGSKKYDEKRDHDKHESRKDKDNKSRHSSSSNSKSKDDKHKSSSSHSKDSRSKSDSHNSKKESKDKRRERKDDHYSSKHRERRSTDRDSNDGSGHKSSGSSICDSASSSLHNLPCNRQDSNSNDSRSSGNSEESRQRKHIEKSKDTNHNKQETKKLLNEEPTKEAKEIPRPKTPPSMSVSMASWEALEAQFYSNMNVNYDSYYDPDPAEKSAVENSKPDASVSIVSGKSIEVAEDKKQNAHLECKVNGLKRHASGEIKDPLVIFSQSAISVDENYIDKTSTFIAKLEKEIEQVEAKIGLNKSPELEVDKENNQNNPSAPIKRKAVATKLESAKRMKKSSPTEAAEIVENQENFQLPLSPAESDSDKSTKMANDGQMESVRRPRASIHTSQRYSSDDLYKPRPFIKRTTGRRRGSNIAD